MRGDIPARSQEAVSRPPAGGLRAELAAAVDVELPKDEAEVGLHRRRRDEHPLSDLGW